MRETLIIVAKLGLILFGILITFFHKKIPSKLIEPRDNELSIIKKELYIEYAKRSILYIGYSYIFLGFLFILNIKIQIFIMFIPLVAVIKINQFYKDLKANK